MCSEGSALISEYDGRERGNGCYWSQWNFKGPQGQCLSYLHARVHESCVTNAALTELAEEAAGKFPEQIAVEGCCHGDLDKIYGTLQQLEKKQNTKIDLLICCGDFQVSLCN